MRDRAQKLAPGKELKFLQEATGEPYKNIQRWVGSGDTKMPARFVALFLEKVPTNPEWLLHGVGDPEPVEPPLERRRLDAIRKILEAEGDDPILGGFTLDERPD